MYQVLEGSSSGDRTSRLCAVFLLGLICLNVVAAVISTIASIGALYQRWFHAFETFSIIVFSFEYALRVWSSREGPHGVRGPIWSRLGYMVSPLAVIDLIAILPFFLTVFGIGDMRFLRVLRLMRLLKLTRYSRSMTLLLQVLREEARSIAAALFILVVLLVFTSSLAYLAEHRAQPQAFGSIPETMWWAIITMTTVGYGDVTPVTVAGKFIAAVIGIIGLGMVALPAGLLASGFTHKLHRMEKQFEALVDEILKDGIVTDTEKARLLRAQADLDLSAEEAAEVIRIRARQAAARRPSCPQCGEKPPPDHAERRGSAAE